MPKTDRLFVAATAALLFLQSAEGGLAETILPMGATGQSENEQHSGQDQSLVRVMIDYAKVLTFAEPARTIIIGNPGIADGTLSDEHTIVLTGKVPGTTNLIVLGEGGRELLNATIGVTPANSQTTVVYSGAARRTYSCMGACKPMLAVGDEGNHFNTARDQIKGRQDFLNTGIGTK